MRKIIQTKNSITNVLFRAVIIPILIVYTLISVVSIFMQIYGIKRSAKSETASKSIPLLKTISMNNSAAPSIIRDFNSNDREKAFILDSRKNIIHIPASEISDSEKNQIIQNFRRGNDKHIIYKKGTEIKSISYFPIENTPGWTLVIDRSITGAFRSVYMHLIFLIASTLVFMIFFYYVSKKVSEKISASINKIADRLQSAAEGDFNSDINYSDEIEEIKYLSTAVHSIISRMNMALSGSDNFEISENVNKILNLDVLKPLINNYKNSMRANLCIKNLKGEVIGGEPAENDTEENVYTANITVNGKNIAIAELSSLEGCIPPKHELPLIVKQVAFTASHLIEKSYNNARQYDIWKKNEEYNIRNLTKSMENFSSSMHQWLAELETGNYASRKDFQADMLMFTAKAKEVLAYIDEKSEYSKFLEYSADIKEADYSPRELSLELQKQISDSLSANDNVDFSISGKIPATLFGDKNSIIKIIKRILITINSVNNEQPLSLKISSEAGKYSTQLIFELSTSKESFSENDTSRLKLISMSKKGFIENLTTFEQKISSAFSLAFKINANIKIETNENLNIKISIPQLNVKELEEL